MNRHVPNLLTLIRFVSIPFIVAALFLPFSSHFGVTLALFLIAMATDVADGYIARTCGLSSKLGMLFDPLADKLLLNTILFALATLGAIPFWIAALLFARDLLSSDFKSFAAYHKVYVSIAPIEGKIKALLETLGISIALFEMHLAGSVVFSKLATIILLLALSIGIVGLIKLFSRHYSLLTDQPR